MAIPHTNIEVEIQPIPSREWAKVSALPSCIPVPFKKVPFTDPATYQRKTRLEPDRENPEYLSRVAEAKIAQKDRILELGTGTSGLMEKLPLSIANFLVDQISKLSSENDPYTIATRLFSERIHQIPELNKFINRKKEAGGIKGIQTDRYIDESEARRFHGYTVSNWESESVEIRAELIAQYWETNLRENYIEYQKAKAMEAEMKKAKKKR